MKNLLNLDPFFKDEIIEFVEEKKEVLEELLTNPFSMIDILHEAHKIAGSAETIGLEAFGNLADVVEQNALSKNEQKTKESLIELRDYILSLEVKFKD